MPAIHGYSPGQALPGKTERNLLRRPLLITENLKTCFPLKGRKNRRHFRNKSRRWGFSAGFPGEVLGLVGNPVAEKQRWDGAFCAWSNQRRENRVQRPDLTALRSRELKKMRKDMQIIFQDPYSSLNPKLTVGQAVMEPMTVHRIGLNQHERRKITYELLEKVGLDQRYFHRYRTNCRVDSGSVSASPGPYPSNQNLSSATSPSQPLMFQSRPRSWAF